MPRYSTKSTSSLRSIPPRPPTGSSPTGEVNRLSVDKVDDLTRLEGTAQHGVVEARLGVQWILDCH